MEQNKIPHIIVDTREQKLSKILDSKKDRITYENKQLDIADVVVSDELAIERKEGFDFVSSIVDNRLFEQIMRLQETYNTPILILEGLNDNVFENVGMKISSIYGALAFISYKLGIAVIPTRNIEDTAIVVERVAYREQIKGGAILLARKAPKGMSIEERRTFIIEGLVDIGPKKAKSLIEEYKTPHKVFKAIKHTEITYTRTGRIKGIKGSLENLTGFGPLFIEKNQKILFDKKKRSLQKKIDDEY